MPISSGAEGHVGVGVDRSIRWVPEGAEDYQAERLKNSYLQRHLNQCGAQEKLKKEEMMKTSLGPHRTQNGGSDMYLIEQRRNTSNTVQDGPMRGTDSTSHTPENPKKTREDGLHAHANNTRVTSTRQPGVKGVASTDSSSKKSRVCAIL